MKFLYLDRTYSVTNKYARNPRELPANGILAENSGA